MHSPWHASFSSLDLAPFFQHQHETSQVREWETMIGSGAMPLSKYRFIVKDLPLQLDQY